MTYQFSEKIQQGILYLVKSDPDFYQEIVTLIKPDYFEFPVHSKLFTIVKGYYEKYHKLPTDEFILEEARKETTRSENLSDYDDELVRINNIDTSSVDNPEYFLDIIEKFARNEAMKQAISDGILLLKEDRVDEIEPLVRKALTVSRNVDIGQEYFTSVSDRWLRMLTKDSGKKYRTISPSLNSVLEGGLGAKELAMVVAPPSVGKSLFLVNQAVESLMEGRKVLYISLEMSEDKIAQRFDSIMSLIPQVKLNYSQPQLKERLSKFKETFSGGELVIKEFPTGLATINTVRALLVQLKNYEDFSPDVIIVDYMELLRPTSEGMAEYQAQQRISEEMRGLAVEKKCLVWTATQTNRQGRSVKIIDDSQLADAYGKIRTCDFSVSLNQSEEEFDNGTMRLYVMKSRNSRQRFIVPLSVDYSTLRIREADEEDEE